MPHGPIKSNLSITFLGATRNVTGSKYLVEANSTRLLIDCGLFQERGLKDRNWEPFPVHPSEVDAVLLTHAHLDHCGLLPKLVKDGFTGRIFATEATIEITKIVLMDSAKLQEEDAEFKRKRHLREKRKGKFPAVPLYTKTQVEDTFAHFESIQCNKLLSLGDGISAVFFDAGHILGSTMIRLSVRNNKEERTVVFSGDLGRKNAPILHNPTILHEADYVVMESTYGDRETTANAESLKDSLEEIINDTTERDGNIIIPSFSVERAQEVLYRLSELLREDRIPNLMVFLDSPMAIRVTDVFRNHPELFDTEAMALIQQGLHPCDFPGLQLCRSTEESKAINQIRGSVVIIAGAGMCNGGRVKHHLISNIIRPNSTILFVGYQAIGTLGRQILDGSELVRIHGQLIPVKAKIVKVEGFSAHADRNELFQWISTFEPQGLKKIFVTHGEEKASRSFAELVKEKLGIEVVRPSYKDKVKLP